MKAPINGVKACIRCARISPKAGRLDKWRLRQHLDWRAAGQLRVSSGISPSGSGGDILDSTNRLQMRRTKPPGILPPGAIPVNPGQSIATLVFQPHTLGSCWTGQAVCAKNGTGAHVPALSGISQWSSIGVGAFGPSAASASLRPPAVKWPYIVMDQAAAPKATLGKRMPVLQLARYLVYRPEGHKGHAMDSSSHRHN